MKENNPRTPTPDNLRHILVCRTDSIGDVMLTLPLCGMIRQYFPDIRLTFLGRRYTEAVIQSCTHVDQFICWDDISADPDETITALNADCAIHVFPDPRVMRATQRAGIPVRIATAGRLHSWKYCNHRVWFSRKNSNLHECQLNMRLLSPLGITVLPELQDIPALYGFQPSQPLRKELSAMLRPDALKVILHPLSKGSAVNWSPSQFVRLSEQLADSGIQVFITGTREEGDRLKSSHPFNGNAVTDLTGKMTLSDLIAFVNQCDVLVAASTGPLHIASALGKKAIGLYSPRRPIHPGRWAPVGTNAEYLVSKRHPSDGAELDISYSHVYDRIMAFSANKGRMN